MRVYQAKKDKSSQNAKIHTPSCREPNGSRTITPRTKRFTYHYSEPPILQNVEQGFDTECGNSEGNAKIPVTLCLHSAPYFTVQRNWISRLGRYLMSQLGLKEQEHHYIQNLANCLSGILRHVGACYISRQYCIEHQMNSYQHRGRV